MARYTDDEVDEILRRAIRRQQKDASGLAHEDLVAAAREIGIEPADVDAAVAEMRAGAPPPARRGASSLATTDDDALDLQERKSRRARFARHLATYVVVNAALVGMNLMTGGSWWVLWVILGWGIGVALQGVGLLLPEDPVRRDRKRKQRRRRHEKEAARERSRLERQARRDSHRIQGKDFERAVQEGVGLLLGAAARKIGDVVRDSSVRHERDRVRVEPGEDRVRVDAGVDTDDDREDAGDWRDDTRRRKRGD